MLLSQLVLLISTLWLTLPDLQFTTPRVRCTAGTRQPRLYGESCPGQEGHPPSLVNFTERLYEKKVDPFARAKS